MIQINKYLSMGGATFIFSHIWSKNYLSDFIPLIIYEQMIHIK